MDSYIVKQSSGGGLFSQSKKDSISSSSHQKTISINQLPTNNKPENFTGAIGDFKLNSSISNNEIEVGDPITLTMDIYGKGNFQRINIPKSDGIGEDWKLYPESFNFKGTNNSNYSGVKSFQQILSPKEISINKMPSFKFTYFNPLDQKYLTLSTPPYDLSLTKGDFKEYENTTFVDNFSEQK